MKKFFEEYGFIILICVVVISLVGIAIGIKPLMASSISNITNSWGSEAKESLDNAWNEDGSSGSQEQDKTQVTPISKTESYIGKYADIDGNGTVDGIIFADLAFDESGTSFSNVTYSYTKSSNLKEYYVSKTATDDFGEQEVISLVDGTTGNDRFYVMALDDIDEGLHDWYAGASYSYTIKNISLTSVEFGSGKQNTANMINAWNNKEYGEQNADTFFGYTDIWGLEEVQADNGWFVPSHGEWAAYAKNLGINEDNSRSRGIPYTYWSSSLSNGAAYSFQGINETFDTTIQNNDVRLATTY